MGPRRPRLDSKIDLPALDIIRDRERGVPHFNEFRRQIGLRQLSGFDDFIDRRLPEEASEQSEPRDLVKAIREVYGQHRCDASRGEHSAAQACAAARRSGTRTRTQARD